jgi:hypothetical protein
VLPGEDPDELAALTSEVARELHPQGAVEAFMAERVAIGMWRLRRAERAELGVLAGGLLQVEKDRADWLRDRCETSAFEELMARDDMITNEAGHLEATAQLADIATAEEDDLPTLGQALARDASGPGTIDLAVRYKSAAERSLFRMLRELRSLQAERTRS